MEIEEWRKMKKNTFVRLRTSSQSKKIWIRRLIISWWDPVSSCLAELEELHPAAQERSAMSGSQGLISSL